LISCPNITFSRRAILRGFETGNDYGDNDDEYDNGDDTLLFRRKTSASFNIFYIILNLLSQTAYRFYRGNFHDRVMAG
jgi:hypothetical protein